MGCFNGGSQFTRLTCVDDGHGRGVLGLSIVWAGCKMSGLLQCFESLTAAQGSQWITEHVRRAGSMLRTNRDNQARRRGLLPRLNLNRHRRLAHARHLAQMGDAMLPRASADAPRHIAGFPSIHHRPPFHPPNSHTQTPVGGRHSARSQMPARPAQHTAQRPAPTGCRTAAGQGRAASAAATQRRQQGVVGGM